MGSGILQLIKKENGHLLDPAKLTDRVWVPASSTRKEDRLVSSDDSLRLTQLRRELADRPPQEAMIYLLSLLAKYPTNEALLQTLHPKS